MSLKRNNHFSLKNKVAFRSNLSLVPLGTWLVPREQLKTFFILGIFLHAFCSWMKKIIQEKVRTQDLWAIKGILTTTLVFFL
jgi:hypothetical protein